MDTLVMDTPLAQSREILAQQQGLIVELHAENARLRAENGVPRELVAQLQERIAELEAKLGPPSGKGTPDFVKASRKKAKKEDPRKKRAENFARKREESTKRIIHAIEQCTECGRMNVPEVDLLQEVVGKSRVNAQTMALIAIMRELGRLPIRSIQWQLGTFHRLSLSVGESGGARGRDKLEGRGPGPRTLWPASSVLGQLAASIRSLLASRS